MALDKYKSKRDFKKTNEPAGARALAGRPSRSSKKHSTNQLIFVVQKHNASHLHYDFRLEIDGVLKSWAVPKGVSRRISDKRLAIMTEDHPLEYAFFEGKIPEGEYGAGTVKIWDKGTYKSEKSMKSALRSGQIEIVLHGKKLKDRYALIRTKMGADSKNWLMIKMKQ
ncbi:DNA ligase [Patescibacteria group bacterium]|nr:DNA ligase [Patescibacteria group bacterium]